jgi:uncharacterized membrane protein YfcA
MSFPEVILVLVAGFGAGVINALIGSGTLITFPALLAVGYPPVVANVSNSLGLVPGAASSAYGYRRELGGSRERLLRFAPLTAAGAVVGAVLLLALPESAFEVIVPILIAISLVLILCQPRISAWVKARREAEEEGRAPAPHGGPGVLGGIFGTGIYGGYFGAGQGILLLAILAIGVPGELKDLNAVRAVLAGIANLVAGIVFLFIADIAWLPVLLIAISSTVGGLVGAGIGRKLPDPALRAVIVVVGLAAIAQLVL